MNDIQNIEHLLIGKWINNDKELFFEGTDGESKPGKMKMSNSSEHSTIDGNYRVYKKDNSLQLSLFSNTAAFGEQFNEYDVVDYSPEQITLRNNAGIHVT